MKDSVEKRISERLKGFVAALKSDAVMTERFTCRTMILDLEPVPYNPKTVKATRKLLHVSQGLFAQFLGVSRNTVCSWEQGTNAPNDMACRFMDEIQRNPEYWRQRLKDSIRIKDPC
jgi:DNA-binding transcriptional regulator YiaG